ncbi:iron-dependent extradiol dioxygenase [Shewanella sp. NFH-SH190041]|uniref:VOC family protein n=1 Tax=Shewanella sp. NFH-SH190041 TaxID=2950245 RepID=UPI0021C48E71|nr:VOC family protein [Shewanella sp. NFH-SH190041]BDM64289.1 iron-dependent extradiol dioxygenase [Shewanella sp. NFH-SH190041]
MDIRALGYYVAQTDEMSQWRDYAENVLGMMTAPAADGGLYIKMDDRPFRMLVVEGADKRYLASGWELASKAAYDAAKQTLEARGIAYQEGDAAFCQLRGAQEVAIFHDPAGNCHELYWGYQSACEPFISPQGVPAFISGDMGLGHTVLPAPDFDKTYAFLTEVMGFGLSDIYHFKPAPDAPAVRIHFMHCANARHHSLAICEFPVPSGCVHVMVEVENMTEVGRAHDRRIAHQVPLSATLGQHLNDKMTSFYMKTPSGFDLEYGCGGLQIDWDKHTAFEFTRVSIWGHDFSVGQQAQ